MPHRNARQQGQPKASWDQPGPRETSGLGSTEKTDQQGPRALSVPGALPLTRSSEAGWAEGSGQRQGPTHIILRATGRAPA